MKITVLGCGALGRLLAYFLTKNGNSVQGWLKEDKKDSIYINITHINNMRDNIILPTNNVLHLNNSDLLIVTLKIGSIVYSLKQIINFINKNCIILLIYNGLGIENKLSFIKQPLLIGITYHAVYKEKEIIYHNHKGLTIIGKIDSTVKDINYNILIKKLNLALTNVIWCKNIHIFKLKKLAVNCVINPLTTIYNCKNGELLKYNKSILSICKELSNILKYMGVSINTKDLVILITSVINNTKNNISSMLQDIKNNKYSEIDYINGYIIKYARLYNLYVYENIKLFNIIKYKELNIINNNEYIIGNKFT
ncbi:MAG: 2-dehydropantoate 2-reductase [Candidatus Lightella neohaematopini]|nr:2-dehydropantoate 2-reductase [Candidatus Lightella neohaematopini]